MKAVFAVAACLAFATVRFGTAVWALSCGQPSRAHLWPWSPALRHSLTLA